MENTKKHNVIVYSTPTCPYCNMAKNYLRDNGIEYKDVNVSIDQNAAREMIQKSGQMAVPVIDINGEIIIGFQPEVIHRLTSF